MTPPGRPHPHLVVALLLVAAVAVSFSPLFQPVPGRDSGMFLYIASRIIDGGVPYRDVWDQKPPLIYLIDAAGLLLAGGSRWGVWAIELVILLAATTLGWRTLKREFGEDPAAVASCAWVVTLPLVLEGGNLTEEFALPLQFAALALFARGMNTAPGTAALGLGLILGAASLLRQNLIGTPAVACLYLVVAVARRHGVGPALRSLVLAAVGVGVTVGAMTLYLVQTGAYAAMMDQSFRFNSLYADWGLSGRLRAMFEGFRITMQSGLSFLALAAWCAGLMTIAITRRAPSSSLARLALLVFPMELILATVSTRGYPHYYTPWLPVSAVLIAALVASVSESIGNTTPAQRRAWAVGLVIAMALLPATRAGYQMVTPDRTRAHAVDYIRRTTAPGEPVLVWGSEPVVNFLAERRAPSRHVVHYVLVIPGYGPRFAGEFIRDLERTPPALILDASTEVGAVPPLDVLDGGSWPARNAAALDGVRPILEHIRARYTRVETIGGWTAYRPASPR